MKKIVLIATVFGFTFFSAQKSENYLQLRYGSICCGTPSTDPVMNYINKFQKKNKIKNLEIYKQGGMGREGEFNLYIGTDNLSKKQTTMFVTGLQSAIETQNNTRKKNHDGTVAFEATEIVKKVDLSNARNLTIYKK